MQHPYYSYTAISSATTTTIVGTSDLVVLHAIIVPKATSGTVTLEDKAGTDYFVLPAATVGATYEFSDIVFPNGLAVVTSASDNVIIVWKQG